MSRLAVSLASVLRQPSPPPHYSTPQVPVRLIVRSFTLFPEVLLGLVEFHNSEFRISKPSTNLSHLISRIMACRWALRRRASLPETRRSLSVDSLLQQENSCGPNMNEAIELAYTVPDTDGHSGSGDLGQLLRNAPSGQTQLSRASSQEQLEQDVVLNNEQTQRIEQTQQNHAYSNARASSSAASPPLISTITKSWFGRVRDWAWEIICMLVAACCLVAIFTILYKFNHQEQPQWPLSSTLNLSTLIALIATVLRSMLENVLNAG